MNKSSVAMMLLAAIMFYLFLFIMAFIRLIAGTLAAILFIADGLFMLIILVNIKKWD